MTFMKNKSKLSGIVWRLCMRKRGKRLLFKEKSTEIKDANDRLQQLQQQINTVCLELDSKEV